MSDKVSGGVDSAEMNHGASSKVIVLTEAETHWLAASVQQESEASGTAQGIYDKLNAALDRDPDALVEQVARVIYSFVGHYSWENYADKARHGSEWLVIGGDAERLRVRSMSDGLTAWLSLAELERSYRVVSCRPGFEGLEERGRMLVRVDAERACQLKEGV